MESKICSDTQTDEVFSFSENFSPQEMNRIIHELEVYKIELEMQNQELKRIHSELDEAKAHYFELYDLAPEGYLIVSEKGNILETNLTGANMFGVTKSTLLNRSFSQYIYKEDQNIYYRYRRMGLDTLTAQDCELRLLKNDGTFFWGHLKGIVSLDEGFPVCKLILNDISERKKAEQALAESEEKYKSLVMSMDQGLALHEIILDEDGKPVDYVFLDINDSYARLLGTNRETCIGKRIKEVMPLVEEYWIDVFGKVAITGEPNYYENYLGTTGKYYATYSYSPKKNQFAVLVSDIDDRVKRENHINYLSYHDQLTGIYNRRFYEEELKRLDTGRNLPLTIAMADLNGLKLINDAFGHHVGDELLKKVAAVIRKGCRADDIFARIGGDEFIIILPNTDHVEAEKVIARINQFAAKEKVGNVNLSVSFGHATKTTEDQNTEDLFKDAEDHMYRQKLYESASIKSKVIELIMNTLYEKDPREQLHSTRVSELCASIAQSLTLSNDDINKIRIAGLMHDIGKIGIDETVLSRVGLLNNEEWKEIKRHPEVSYRILSSCIEFSELATFALEHHERWDGQGYPKGIKGQDISLPARIIAIADAFDAMTNTRTYKEAISEKEALEEIRRCGGTQFDPEIVKIFLEHLPEIFPWD